MLCRSSVFAVARLLVIWNCLYEAELDLTRSRGGLRAELSDLVELSGGDG